MTADETADGALVEADAAFAVFRAAPAETRARLLEEIAEGILGLGDELLTTADRESGLGLPRLQGERARTVGQLRRFAAVVREGSWVDARIDTRDPARTPPKPDLRRMLVPVGPVVVFAASNFPLAFSVAGGDTASALAAGCPVILRAHPAHPATSELVGAAVSAAVARAGLPARVFTLVLGEGHAVGLALVRHPLAQAVAFTGSLRGGRALFDAAAARPAPIPVYAEMGSTNPVFILPGALAERGAALGATLADSATLGTGQFCTKPGLIFAVDGPGFADFAAALATRVGGKPPARMLYPEIAARFREGVAEVARAPGVEKLAEASGDAKDDSGRPVAWQVSVDDFLRAPALRDEVFGPSTILVRARARSRELARRGRARGPAHGERARDARRARGRAAAARDPREAGRAPRLRRRAHGRRGLGGHEPRRALPREHGRAHDVGRHGGHPPLRAPALLAGRRRRRAAARARRPQRARPLAARRRPPHARRRRRVMTRGPLDADDPSIYDVRTRAPGPPGRLPVTADDLIRRPSGDLFGWTQDVGMGLPARELGRPEVLVLATSGGVRAPDGTPVALGYHTGHWEIGLLVEEAARARSARGAAFRSRASAPIPATAARKGRPACSTACRTATTRRSSCGGSSARCRRARRCWASRRATRACRR